MPEFLRYRDDLEQIAPGEAATFQKIADLMLGGQHTVRERLGRSVRISHAKAHGFLKGELVVHAGLPPELAQGLFAQAGPHPVLVRLAQVPGEMLDDRRVSSPRGMAIKVFGAAGTKLPGHEGATTQDFLLNTGKAFFAKDAAGFLAAFTPNATVAPRLPEAVKGVASVAARAANAALGVVGLESGMLDVYGHPKAHPLAESYYSQAPIRYGEYVAKVGVVPASDALKELAGQSFGVADENGLRTATAEFFRASEARYDVQVQLAVDETRTPVEDPTAEWPEDVTPYRTVATLVLPPQDAYNPARQDAVDHTMSFAPGHALAAHRPLGQVMRARLFEYPVLSHARRAENGTPAVEPARIEDVPG